MPGPAADLNVPATDAPGANPRAWLLEALRRVLVPLCRPTSSALAYLAHGTPLWLSACDQCPCSKQQGESVPCSTPGVKGRSTFGFEIPLDGRYDGTLFLCCDRSSSDITETIQGIVQGLLQQLEFTREKDYLLGELSASRESLEAVYDISSNLRAVEKTEELLKRIVERVTAHQPDLHVILWLNEEDTLISAASCNVPPVAERPLSGGLVGKTLSNRTSILLNGRSRLNTIEDLEMELLQANSVAIVPVVGRQGLLGALEIWQNSEQAKFDSRLLYLLETLALLAAMVVENDRLHRDALASARLRHDVEIGSRIQQVLLLGRTPVDLELIRAAALTIPSMQIDGDFYDFVEHEKTLDIIVGDVMGKGIAAALVGAATKNQFLRAMNYLLASQGGMLPEPKEILSIVNAELVKQLIGIESYVTLIYARFDLKNSTLSLIDCGHTRTIHISSQTGQYSLLQGDNMPLGFSPGEVYEPITVPFEAGDVFLFYSDGVTEMPNPEGEYYGETRLAELVQSNGFLDPKDLVEVIRKDVLTFSQAESFRDDLTCVAVKVQDMEATIPSKRARLDILSNLPEIGKVRTFVREFCYKNIAIAFREEDLDQLELAVTEAVTNVIRHGYQGQKDRPIRVQADLFLNRISIRLYHRGQAFDPGNAPAKEIDSPREGGMGLYIIEQCVDKVRYYRSKHGENCVHLIKQFKMDPGGGRRSGPGT